jgi:hypothetical protein
MKFSTTLGQLASCALLGIVAVAPASQASQPILLNGCLNLIWGL